MPLIVPPLHVFIHAQYIFVKLSKLYCSTVRAERGRADVAFGFYDETIYNVNHNVEILCEYLIKA